jgi:hypothetical protein
VFGRANDDGESKAPEAGAVAARSTASGMATAMGTTSTLSESVIEEQPLWLDDLLNEQLYFGNSPLNNTTGNKCHLPYLLFYILCWLIF